jgi:hypothetical protein
MFCPLAWRARRSLAGTKVDYKTQMADTNYITEEVKALIGLKSEPVEACHPVEASEVRRFHHAIMDPAWRYFDENRAAKSRYKGIVAPPIFPILAFRRHADGDDPLALLEQNPEFDGLNRHLRDLPPVPVELKRLLNGGYEYTFYRYAKIGDRIFRQSRYQDIFQKEGRSGAMVFVVIDDWYFLPGGERLVEARNTLILR